MPSKYGESRKNDSENKENKEANKLISPNKNVSSNPLSVQDPCSSAKSSIKLKSSGVVEMCVDEDFKPPGRTCNTEDMGRRLRLASFRNSKSCRLCWTCCCCNCSCAQARNHETNNILSGKNPADPYYNLGTTEQTPTVEDIRSWGESFDRLMRSQGGRKLFRDFLKCEYSEENMLFWLACEDLKNESNPENVEEKARLIYEDYISILSPKEVSLDSRVRDIVNKNMIHPTHRTFDEAQMQIYTLMHRDSYPRFVNSALYKKMAQITSASRKESIA